MVIGTEHGRYGLSCMQKLCSAQAVLGLYVMLECKLCCEILLLLNCMRKAVERAVVSALFI